MVSIGANTLSKVKIIFIVLLISLFNKINVSTSSKSLYLKIHQKNVRVFFDGTHAELLMLEEIFFQQIYNLPIKSPRWIIDLGANIGLSALFFATKYPTSTIVAVEPDPNTFAVLQKNCQPFSNIILINAAVAKQKGAISFFRNEKHNASSLHRRSDADSEIVVTALTLRDIFEQNHIDVADIVKFDIEGAEFDCFQDWQDWFRIKTITGEIHEDLASSERYDLVKVFAQHYVMDVQPGGKRDRYIITGNQ